MGRLVPTATLERVTIKELESDLLRYDFLAKDLPQAAHGKGFSSESAQLNLSREYAFGCAVLEKHFFRTVCHNEDTLVALKQLEYDNGSCDGDTKILDVGRPWGIHCMGREGRRAGHRFYVSGRRLRRRLLLW